MDIPWKMLARAFRVAFTSCPRASMVESSLHAPIRAFTAASAPLDIVHEDCHYLFVNKPAGLSVAGNEGSPDGDTFHGHVKIHVAENYGSMPALLSLPLNLAYWSASRSQLL